MKILKSLMILSLLILCLGCLNQNVTSENMGSNVSELYIEAYESIMSLDSALSENIKYISLNMDNLESITDINRKEINDYFKGKYNIEIFNSSFKALEEKGFVKEGNYIEGVLLNIDSVDYKSNTSVNISGSKFRSGLGAVGVEVKLNFRNGKWISETNSTWIS
ncbi:peptide ABC transporter substrate-binding protein [Cohnella lupini]|uniref:Mce-associated membrane protein n=1 Tax=Cohnella lupini TaxID=1294267 RepID=A0A3D9IXA8_9BACL|nr:peptide ABC transporter substrate-binding protein [Cohnella lupini]RED66139.1 hypothetical protein DFP95_101637 [Cohnella lupini]